MTPIKPGRRYTVEFGGREPERNLTALIAAVGYVVVLVVIAALVMFGVPFAVWLFLGAGQ